jgi:transcriptional regulator
MIDLYLYQRPSRPHNLAHPNSQAGHVAKSDNPGQFMYVPAHFNEPDIAALHGLIDHNPLGILFTHGASGMDANHLPFDLAPAEGKYGVLHAHVARANPLWQELGDGDEVLVVFRAADAYISPNWYPSKHETHKQVPTWNYRVVHAHGRIRIRDDERYVRGLVARLTRKHESSQPLPWKMTDGPKDYIAAMLQAIVGIEIEITGITGKFKLAQNKETRDIRGAGEALRANGDTEVGEAMIAVADQKA